MDKNHKEIILTKSSNGEILEMTDLLMRLLYIKKEVLEGDIKFNAKEIFKGLD